MRLKSEPSSEPLHISAKYLKIVSGASDLSHTGARKEQVRRLEVACGFTTQSKVVAQ